MKHTELLPLHGTSFTEIQKWNLKSPAERIPVMQMLKHSKEEFDRLMETSPSISDEIISKFNDAFSDGLSKAKGIVEGELKRDKKHIWLL